MENLEEIIKKLLSPGKGILAADESFPTIEKRFKAVGIKSSKATRGAYRELLFTTPNIEKYISGIIMFDETIRQKTKEEVVFPDYLSGRGIIPGIKIDEGLSPYEASEVEKVTKGLEGLGERLGEYKALGAKFTKFRSAFTISETTPSLGCIQANADIQAQFAKLSQEKGLLPICEPEVLMDGDHSAEKCSQVTTTVLKEVFNSLKKAGVDISQLLLKTNMVLAGKESKKISSEMTAKLTIEALRNSVPAEVVGIVFLSGGQTPSEACQNLNAITRLPNQPWILSFSFARALQEEAMDLWQGKEENILEAQNKFLARAKMVSLARLGEYKKDMENE